MAEKPSVLIIGGLGYIGRFLALHIHKNSLASEVRLVDKVLPQLAWLAPEFEEACAADKFMQADASRERMQTLLPLDGPCHFPVVLPTASASMRLCLLSPVPLLLTSFYRGAIPDIRSCGRETVGLCVQLRRRDPLLAGGRGV